MNYSAHLGEALQFTADAFSGRTRKATPIPYLTHLLQVAAWVGESGGDEEQIIAALLHDYLEDIPGATALDLSQRFGDRVTAMVLALSDSTTHPKPPWRDRKERHLAHMRGLASEIKLISACDKLHNASSTLHDLRTLGSAVWDRFNAPCEDSLWYYRSVVDALGDGWPHPRVTQLQGVVLELHRESGVYHP